MTVLVSVEVVAVARRSRRKERWGLDCLLCTGVVGSNEEVEVLQEVLLL